MPKARSGSSLKKRNWDEYLKRIKDNRVATLAYDPFQIIAFSCFGPSVLFKKRFRTILSGDVCVGRWKFYAPLFIERAHCEPCR